MHAAQGWLLTARIYEMALSIWGVVMIVHAAWRSQGNAAPDPIRESGPIF